MKISNATLLLLWQRGDMAAYHLLFGEKGLIFPLGCGPVFVEAWKQETNITAAEFMALPRRKI